MFRRGRLGGLGDGKGGAGGAIPPSLLLCVDRTSGLMVKHGLYLSGRIRLLGLSNGSAIFLYRLCGDLMSIVYCINLQAQHAALSVSSSFPASDRQ